MRRAGERNRGGRKGNVKERENKGKKVIREEYTRQGDDGTKERERKREEWRIKRKVKEEWEIGGRGMLGEA